LAYVLILAIVALGVPLAINLRGRVNAEVRTQSQAQADLVAATAADLLGPRERPELSTLAQTAARSVRGRILIVNRAGSVLVDSAGPAQVGTSYGSRPEIRAALRGRPVQVQRNSRTLGQEILATAVPIIREGHPVGAVRVTQSVAAVNSAVRRVFLGLGLLALVVLALGLLAGAVIAAQVVRPIRRLEEVARRVAGGDLRARAVPEGSREQVSLARSFNDMTERMARLLRAQRDFVADASHQLRTPLTALRLRLEAARAHEAGGAAAAGPVGEIDAAIAEVDRLSGTVDELLVLSGTGERQLSPGTIDLHDLASSAVARWRGQAADTGIVLDQRSEPGDCSAWAAGPDLERALDALVENALHYAPSGSTVTVVDAPGRIEVHDRGPGIAEDERELVFERFHRGRAGRRGPSGSGLGLSIARELMRAWAGDVTVAPRSGGGTIATLTVPRAAAVRAGEPDDHFARA
jgi:signal transduction histidine kinase